MGEQQVSIVKSQDQMQHFVKSLLDDVKALEYMLDNDWFETDIVRIGAEQEMVLVDQKTLKPACINMQALGINSLRANSATEILWSFIHVNLESMPNLAALLKLSNTSSKLILLRISPTSSCIWTIAPSQRAALAASSSTVGPEGSTRFSIRRWGLPFSLIP